MDHVRIFHPSGVCVRPFTGYINEVAQLLADSKLAMYADDVLLYRPVHSTADLIWY